MSVIFTYFEFQNPITPILTFNNNSLKNVHELCLENRLALLVIQLTECLLNNNN